MQYPKPIIKKSSRFETIKIRLVFPFIEDESDIANDTLLPRMLNYMCNKYPTEEVYKKEKLDRYIINMNCHCSVLGTTGFFCFNLTIPDSKVLSNKEIEKAIELLYEIVYYPKIIKGGFDKFELTREIDNIKLDIDNSKKNVRGFIANELPNLIDDVGIYKRGIYNNINLLDKVTPTKLYKFYQNIIKTKSPYCFAYGNVDKNFMNKIFKKYFLHNEVVSFNYKIDYFLKPCRSTPQIVTYEKDFKQSAVCLVFKIKNYRAKDKVTLKLIGSLLRNSTTNLLFKKLRLEEGLVYSVDAITRNRYGIFELRAFCDKDKLEYTKNKMLEVVNSLKDKVKISQFLKILHEDFKIGMIEDKDDSNYLLKAIMDQYFHIRISDKKAYRKRKRCRALKIAKLVDRFQLDTILYVKEVHNAK